MNNDSTFRDTGNSNFCFSHLVIFPVQNLIFYKTLSRLIFCYQIYRKALYLAKFNDVNFPNDNIRDYIMLYRFSKLIRENIREIFISATRTEG